MITTYFLFTRKQPGGVGNQAGHSEQPERALVTAGDKETRTPQYNKARLE